MANEIESLLERVAIHRKNLQHLLNQAALSGLSIPLPILNQISYEQAALARIKSQLLKLGHVLDDHPDDTTEIESLSTVGHRASSHGSDLPVPAVPQPPSAYTIRPHREHISLMSRPPRDEPSPERLHAAHTLLAALPLDGMLPAPNARFASGSRMQGIERNPDFVGREEALLTMAHLLKGDDPLVINPTVVVSGLGGIGKTNLVAEWVYRYGQYFAGGVFWLSFADPSLIESDIAACGTSVFLDLFDETHGLTPADQAARVIKAWNIPIPRVLIFDSCEDPQLALQYRDKLGIHCRIVITSRRGYWRERTIHRVALTTFQRHESCRLLERLCPQIPRQESQQIAQVLGDFPLALHLSACYLAEYDESATQYLAELGRINPLDHEALQGRGVDRLPAQHEVSVYRTFQKSYATLDPTHPRDTLTIAVLCRIACCAPGEPLPREFIARTLPTHQPKDVVDALRRAQGIGCLDGRHTVTMHGLVASFLALMTPVHMPHAQADVEAAVQASLQTSLRDGYLLDLTPLRVHFMYVTQQALQRADLAAATLAQWMAIFLVKRSVYADAERIQLAVQSIRESHLGDDHPDTAATWQLLGEIYLSQGRYVEAEKLYQRALRVRMHIYGEMHPDTAETINHLGVVSFRQGKMADGATFMEQALAIRETILGEDHLDTASSLSTLAALYTVKGNYQTAETLQQRSHAIRNRLLPPHHPDRAMSLNNLGLLFYTKGAYEQAEDYYQHALDIRKAGLGDDHPRTAESLNNLATLYAAQGHYAKSEQTYQQALTIWTHTLGEDHPETATALNNLADLYKTQGRFTEALPLFEHALEIWREALGNEHPYVAVAISNIGEIHAAEGRYVMAAQAARDALRIRGQVLGEAHADTAISVQTLGEIAMAQGGYEEAEAAFLRARGIREQALGRDHPDTAQTLRCLADVSIVTGRFDDAEPLLARAEQVFEQTLGSHHPSTIMTQYTRAKLAALQGAYHPAHTLGNEVLSRYESIFGHDHPQTTTVRAWLALLERTMASME